MKYFDMFAGVGGFSLGIERAYVDVSKTTRKESDSLDMERGLPVDNDKSMGTQQPPTCVGMSEIDKYASAVLKYRYPNVKNYGDCTKINWTSVPDFDLLVGGSPCQDFSTAGKRSGLRGERSGLFTEYLRALEEKQPNYFIWENVKGVLSSRRGWDFSNIITAFSEAGYSLWWQVLNAKDFGVPQNRERIFVVGTRNGSPREVLFERESNQEDSDSRIVGGTITGRYPASQREGAYIETHGDNKRATGKIKQINNPTHSNDRVYGEEGVAPTLNTMQGGRRQPFVKVPEATPSECTCKEWFSEHGDLNYKNCNNHDSGIRKLTPRECERLMSWPDDWTSHGFFPKHKQGNNKIMQISDSQRYKMCGNGVVSEVVKHVVRELIL